MRVQIGLEEGREEKTRGVCGVAFDDVKWL
jgi:hypothetical protein